jgi:hypothetical protein
MIRYSLQCSAGHGFEGWFSSSQDHEEQKARGVVACPVCGSHDVGKTLMAPSVSTGRKKEARRELAARQAAALPADPKKREMLKQIKELRDKVLAGAEDVGERFSEEARKIHYGEAEARGIFGQASVEEAVELMDEGIDVMPIPELPEDRN